MGINFAMWRKAIWQLIKMDDKQQWDGLDVVSKWLIATRSAVTLVTVYSCIIAGLLAWRDRHFSWIPWIVVTLGLFIAHGTNNLIGTRHVQGSRAAVQQHIVIKHRPGRTIFFYCIGVHQNIGTSNESVGDRSTHRAGVTHGRRVGESAGYREGSIRRGGRILGQRYGERNARAVRADHGPLPRAADRWNRVGDGGSMIAIRAAACNRVGSAYVGPGRRGCCYREYLAIHGG